MAAISPLQTLRYDPSAVGSIEAVIAPPYDVIDEELRAQLLAKSPFNVVEIDLPKAPGGGGVGGDQYQHAEETFEEWRRQSVIVQESEPAFWGLRQDYTAPDGSSRTRTGFFARVRVEEYGPGKSVV